MTSPQPAAEPVADLLRRSAATLRAAAARATRGPWNAAQGTDNNWVVDGDIRPQDHAWVALMMFGDDPRADAEYIARMHPPTALAIAGLLEHVADDMQDERAEEKEFPFNGPDHRRQVVDERGSVRYDWTAAVAVARAVLREDGESA